MEKKIPIMISAEVWKVLSQLKEPGDSFDDVLRRLLNLPLQR